MDLPVADVGTLFAQRKLMSESEIRHILYVDDDQDDLEIFRDTLKQVYPQVNLTTVSNSANMLPVLYKLSLPDVIVLDVNMPVYDGIECLKQIRNSHNFSSTPVVLYATSKQSTTVKKSIELGANHFIQKGSSLQEVYVFIKNLCEKNLQSIETEE
jgi:CheY-like chemotaxis protein